MGERTTIAWTDATWNPTIGCSRVSAGCQACYAERMAARFSGPGLPYEGVAQMTPQGARWTGQVKLLPDKLAEPLKWRKPKRVFVDSMSDLFHGKVPFEFIDQVFAVMALTPRHTYQILTKRPDRMLEYLVEREDAIRDCVASEAPKIDYRAGLAAAELGGVWQDEEYGYLGHLELSGYFDGVKFDWPLKNVWLGVSVENQPTADERIPLLLQCPATVWWVSAEPLLGPIEFRPYTLTERPCFVCETEDELGEIRGTQSHPINCGWRRDNGQDGSGIDWVVAGGESGPGARPMHPDWVRSLRDQCVASGVRFLVKQWGEWAFDLDDCDLMAPQQSDPDDYLRSHQFPDGTKVYRVGKKRAGRLLDGVLWDQYPEVSQ